MSLNIKKKIIINAVCISSISVMVAGGLILWRVGQSGIEFFVKKEQERLTSIRYFKSQQIDSYFKNLAENISILSTSKVTVDALQDFSRTFPKYLLESRLASVGYNRKIIEQYLNDFAKKYQYYNVGKTIDVQKIFNLISESGFALQYKYIFDNPYALSEKYKLTRVPDNSQYSIIHAKYHQIMTVFKQQFGFNDIFFVDQNGNIVYTVDKGIEFSMSLMDGPYSNSNLATVFRQIMESNSPNFVAISDFAPYLASYDNQAAFIGMGAFDQAGNKIGAVIAELSVDSLNKIMTNEGISWQKIGLGKSINAVIIGADLKLRTDNRFFLENASGFLDTLKKFGFEQSIIDLIKVKKSCIGILKTDTLAVRNALAGQTGIVDYTDYRNIPVIGSFAPLIIPGLNWIIVVKIDKAEVFAGIKVLKEKVLQDGIEVAILIAMVASFLGMFTAGSIIQYIYKVTEEINNIAQTKDLTKRIEVQTNSEFIIMINAFNNFIDNMQHTLQNIQDTVSNKLQHTQDNEAQEIPKDVFDLVDEIKDLSKEFKIIEDKNDRIKYW